MSNKSLAIIFEEIFESTLVGYLLFLGIDNLMKGFVTDFFNINIILLIVLLSGFGVIIFSKNYIHLEESVVKDKFHKAVIAPLIVCVLTYLQLQQFGIISAVIAVNLGVLTYLISTEIFNIKS